MRAIFILLLLSATVPLSAQLKYEREYRLALAEVPKKAINFLEALSFQSKIRWYKEESLTATSYEAKFRHDRQKYSIEFDSTGVLEDVEIKIKWLSIREATRQAISKVLDSQFSRHRLVKIQRQWSGDTKTVLQATKSGVIGEGIVERYETVIKGKSATGLHWYEITFSASGILLTQKRIILRNTDNLEY